MVRKSPEEFPTAPRGIFRVNDAPFGQIPNSRPFKELYAATAQFQPSVEYLSRCIRVRFGV